MKKIVFIVVIFAVISIFFITSNVLAQKCLKGHEERVVSSGGIFTQIQCHVDYCTEISVYVPHHEDTFVCDEYAN